MESFKNIFLPPVIMSTPHIDAYLSCGTGVSWSCAGGVSKCRVGHLLILVTGTGFYRILLYCCCCCWLVWMRGGGGSWWWLFGWNCLNQISRSHMDHYHVDITASCPHSWSLIIITVTSLSLCSTQLSSDGFCCCETTPVTPVSAH